MTLRENIKKVLDQYPIIQAVGVESPPYGEAWSEGLYALFTYVNEAVWSRRKDVVYFDPTQLKMLVKVDPSLRSGKMFKSDMIDAAKEETGITKWSSDEADAYHVAKFSARFWGFFFGDILESELTPSEHQSFAKIHTYTRGAKAGMTVRKGAVFKEKQRFFRYSLLK